MRILLFPALEFFQTDVMWEPSKQALFLISNYLIINTNIRPYFETEKLCTCSHIKQCKISLFPHQGDFFFFLMYSLVKVKKTPQTFSRRRHLQILNTMEQLLLSFLDGYILSLGKSEALLNTFFVWSFVSSNTD